MLSRLTRLFVVFSLTATTLVATGCVLPPQVTSNSWNITWPEVPGAARYDVYADNGDGIAKLVSATSYSGDVVVCSQGTCRVNYLGSNPDGVTRVQVVTIGTDGFRSEPSAWVSVQEAGMTPVLTNIHARQVVDNRSGNTKGASRVEVTGDVAVRDGLTAKVSVTSGELIPSGGVTEYPVGPSTTAWTGPAAFNYPKTIDHKFLPSTTSSTTPAHVWVYAEASYPFGQRPRSAVSVPVESTDQTPPAAPAITISGRTLHITPGAGEPAASYAIFRWAGFVGERVTDATAGDNTLPLTFNNYPLTQQSLLVAAYDAAGNWSTSALAYYPLVTP